MKRIALGLAYLALLSVGACTNITAPVTQEVDARLNGGTVGSGYRTTPPDSSVANGGMAGSGY